MVEAYKFRVNENVEVAVDKSEDYYKSIIQSSRRDHISIGLPMKQRKTLLLHEGEKVQIRRAREDAIYYYDARVLSRSREGGIPLYRLSIPQETRRVQRRNFYRLETLLPLAYRIKPEKEQGEGGEEREAVPWEKTTLVNIGGGGLKFIPKGEIPQGVVLEMEIGLPDHTLRVEGCVVRLVKVNDLKLKHLSPYRVSVQFRGMRERERDKLIGFIFQKTSKKS